MTSELSDKEGQNQRQDISQDPQQEINTKGDNTQILIKNIPESTTEELIQKNFEKFGKILKIKITQDMEGKPLGEALIEFETKQEKDSALNSNEEIELEGKKIEVKDPNEGLTLFVGNIPYSSRKEEVIDFFSDCGKVDVKFFCINKLFKGYAYVTFQDENAVETALKKQGEKIGEREIKIEKLKTRNFTNMQRGRRGGYRGGGNRGRGGPSFGHFDRERKEDYFRERRERLRYREIDRGRPYNRTRDREREWNRDRRDRSRNRSREYNRIRDRGDRSRNDRSERERERERDRDRDRHREFERDKGERSERGERDREKENERHREYERERINRDNRERERDRDRERRHSNYDTDKW